MRRNKHSVEAQGTAVQMLKAAGGAKLDFDAAIEALSGKHSIKAVVDRFGGDWREQRGSSSSKKTD